MAIESEKARKQQSVAFYMSLKDFGFLEASLGSPLALLEPSWGGLGAFWSILEAILSQLELS